MSIENGREPPTPRIPRWLLIALVAIVGINLLDIAGTFANAPQYAALQVPFPISIKIGLSALWVIAFVLLTIDLLQRNHWAFNWTGPLLTIYGASNVVWLFLFARSDYSRGQLLFQIVITIILLLPVWWVVVRGHWLHYDKNAG